MDFGDSGNFTTPSYNTGLEGNPLNNSYNPNFDDTNGGGTLDTNFWGGQSNDNYTTGQSQDPSSGSFDPAYTGSAEPSFMDSFWNRFKQFGMGRGVGELGKRAGVAAPFVGPVVAGLTAPEGQGTQRFGNALTGNVLNTALYGINPLLGGVNSLMGMMTGKSLGGMLQSVVNPEGRVAPSNSGGSSDTNKSYGNVDNILTGLAGLYQNHQNNKGLSGQINSLTGMYGENSPYAQTLRTNLERKDAAGGRRNSGAGTREVELQARLAQMASQNSGAVADLRGQRNKNNIQNLNSLMYLGRSSGLFDKLGKGIQGLLNPEPDYNRLLDQQG